ncbi:MAG: uracil phosphoribosyltransferase, partial [Sulfolobales archaeon]
MIDHPYAQAILTVLRDRRTSQIEFRKGLVRLGRVLG